MLPVSVISDGVCFHHHENEAFIWGVRMWHCLTCLSRPPDRTAAIAHMLGIIYYLSSKFCGLQGNADV